MIPASLSGYIGKEFSWLLAQEAVIMERNAALLSESADSPTPVPNSHLTSLRSTLAWLKAQGDLIESNREINPDLELTGLQKLMDGGCPALFANVKGKPNHRLLTNLFGNIEVMNRMFGWASDRERTVKLAGALNRPLPPVEIAQSQAPCQEVVIPGPANVNDYLV